jgi:hypothetical protein
MTRRESDSPFSCMRYTFARLMGSRHAPSRNQTVWGIIRCYFPMVHGPPRAGADTKRATVPPPAQLRLVAVLTLGRGATISPITQSDEVVTIRENVRPNVLTAPRVYWLGSAILGTPPPNPPLIGFVLQKPWRCWGFFYGPVFRRAWTTPVARRSDGAGGRLSPRVMSRSMRMSTKSMIVHGRMRQAGAVSRPVYAARPRGRVARSRPGVKWRCHHPPRLPRREQGRIWRLRIGMRCRQRRNAAGKNERSD